MGPSGLTFVQLVALVWHALDHDHTTWMALEEVVDEWDEHDDARWRGDEGKSREALDEGGNHGGWEEAGLLYQLACLYMNTCRCRTYGEARKVSSSRKNLARYLTCMTCRSSRPYSR